MADPISIVTGVAGLIKASFAITKSLTNIISSVKDAPAQAAIAVADMSETRTILGQLQNFLLRFETADKSRTALVQVDQLVDVISGCVVTFSEFEATLDKIAGSSMTLVGRAKWAMWDEEKISSLVARLQRHMSSLSLLVTILTSETQLEILDSIKKLKLSAENSYPDTLRSSQLLDNESMISGITNSSQMSSNSDTGSVVTVLHSPRDLHLVPEIQYHYAFEPELKRSRPYRKMNLDTSASTISVPETNVQGWSVLSGFSLAEISNLSILSLNISMAELYNPNYYETSGEHSAPVRSKLPERVILQQQVLQGKVKASRLKSMWNPGTANVRSNRLHKKRGGTANNEAVHRLVLEVNEKSLEPEQKSALDTVSESEQLNGIRNKLLEARTMYQRALAGTDGAIGPENKSTQDTTRSLGRIYNNQDTFVKAEAMYHQALDCCEKDLGPDHEWTLTTAHSLGVVYVEQGKLVEAEAMFLRALPGREKALGAENISTLNTIDNLGDIYNRQNKLVEAGAMYQRVLAGRDKALGPQHEMTLDTACNLGRIYEKQDRLGEAEAVYHKALACYAKDLEPERESALKTVYNLGRIYIKQGKLVEAEATLLRALAGMEKVLGAEHELTADTTHDLGHAYSKQNKLIEAEATYQRALARSENVYGAEHERTLTTVYNIGCIYHRGGKEMETEAMFQRALDGYEKALGPDHTRTQAMILELERLYRKQGKIEEAEALEKRAAVIASNQTGLKNHHSKPTQTRSNRWNSVPNQTEPRGRSV